MDEVTKREKAQVCAFCYALRNPSKEMIEKDYYMMISNRGIDLLNLIWYILGVIR